MTPSINSNSSSTPADSTSLQGSSPKQYQDIFLKLLIAQLKNQDPMNPTDGTQFVAELAQFQQLDTAMNTSQDVAAIRQDLEGTANSDASTNATQS